MTFCRTHNVSVCLYIMYISCGSPSLYIKTMYFFLTVLALSAAATVANIKIRYDAKIPQFAIFGTRVIYVFYSNLNKPPGDSLDHTNLGDLIWVNTITSRLISGLMNNETHYMCLLVTLQSQTLWLRTLVSMLPPRSVSTIISDLLRIS